MAKKLKPEQAKDVHSLRKVLRFTGRDTLKELARKVLGYRRRGTNEAEHASALIREAVKSKFLHPGAFGKCLSLLGMDEGKRALWLASFDQYREAMGLDLIKQGSLKFDDETKADKAKADKPWVERVAAAANGSGEHKADDPPRAESLVDKSKEPSADQIKEIADRAEAASTSKH